MKTTGWRRFSGLANGFTLIEMIGVMAIMAILASVLVPNGLRTLDRAAVNAEAQTLHNLGEQVKLFLKVNGVAPAPATWAQDLGPFADISPVDITTNKRQMVRVLIYEPVLPAAPQRALILSSMRPGLALPVAADLNTVARFDDVWGTADRAIPAVGIDNWAGWAPWRATDGGGDFLVIERVNLAAIYHTDLQDLTITLNNLTGRPVVPPATALAAVSTTYVVVWANGDTPTTGTIAATKNRVLDATALPRSLHPRDRIDLYRVDPVPAGTPPDYSYVLSTQSRTFDFIGTTWIPQ